MPGGSHVLGRCGCPELKGRRLSGGRDRGRDRDRGHPNRVPHASDARVHPTIYDGRSSTTPALGVVHDAVVRHVCSGSHDAQWLRATCGRRAQRVAGNPRRADAALR